MSRRPARWILEDALSSTTRALEALNDGETVVAVQILAGLACGDRDRDRRGAGQPVRELRAPFRLARSVGASHAVRALGRALDAVGAGGVMSGPPDETYFVDSDDIEFGEGYDMSKLPPPLPTAEQVAEAWTAGEHDDLDPRPAGDPELADGPVFVDLREREMRNVHWHDRPFLPAGELVTNNADGDTGKGLVAVHYAARFSHGEFGERRMVVFAVAEDDFETC